MERPHAENQKVFTYKSVVLSESFRVTKLSFLVSKMITFHALKDS